MSDEITKLQRTQFSGIEYANIITDIKNAILESPDYNSNWDNFVDSDAGKMLVELFAWITDQLATRIDWVVNENFLTTATQRSSILKLLKLIGYQLGLPKAAMITVACKPDSLINNIIPLTVGFSTRNINFAPYSITANDSTGNSTSFEALYFNETTKKFDYKRDISIDYTNDITVTNLAKSITFFEGTTRVETHSVLTADNMKIILNNTPITADSIQIYYDSTLTELLKVNSFIDYEARTYQNLDETYNAIPYTINTLEGNAVQIEFAPANILPATNRRPVYGKMIYIIYRTGGGAKGNITARTINTTKVIAVNGAKVNVTFTNSSVGVGGENAETLEHAMYYGPAQIRTSNKTVTKEDYDIILNNFANILVSNSIGFNNLSTLFYDKYGYYPSPLQVMNFITLKKAGYETLPTSQYNQFKWADLKLEDRLNENIAFNNGELNYEVETYSSQVVASANLDIFGTGVPTPVTNYLQIGTFSEVNDNIWLVDDEGVYSYNPDMLIGLTKIESSLISVASIVDPVNNADWFFIPTTTDCSFDLSTDPVQVSFAKEGVHAEFFSDLDIYDGVTPTADAFKFTIALDNRQPVTVTYTPATLYSAQELIDEINEEVLGEYHGYTDLVLNPVATGYQRVGITDEFGDGITAVWDGDEKVLAHALDGFTQATDRFGLSLRIYHRDGGTGVITTEERSYSFFLDGNKNPYDPMDPRQELTDEVLPESNDWQSYIDTVAILNRVLNFANDQDPDVNGNSVSNVKVVIETNVGSERELGSCYDIFFRPNDEYNAPNDVVGVEVIGYIDPPKDIGFLLNGGTLVYPAAKIAADYTDCAQLVSFLYEGSTQNHIKITSPTVDEYSSIEFPTYNILYEDSDIYEDLFGLTEKGICYGVQRLSLMTNRSSSLGSLIYEVNKFYIPSWFKNMDSFTVGAVTDYTYRNIYLSLIFSTTDSIAVGNTSAYYTSDSVEYIYNTVIDAERNVVEKDSDFLIKFTNEAETGKNSFYSITSDLNVTMKSKPIISSIPVTLPMSGALSIAIDYTNGPNDDPLGPDQWDARLITVSDLHSYSTMSEIYDQLEQAFELKQGYYDYAFTDYFLLEGDALTILSNELDGKILFDPGEDDGVGAITLFDITFVTPATPYEIVTTGDYTLTSVLDPATNKRTVYINKVPGSVNFPDGDFYVHYINDRRYEIDHLTNDPVELDEDHLEAYLYPYKIIGVENVFLKPIFKTFDIAGIVTYDKSYSKDTIKRDLEERLRVKYGTIKFNKRISKSEILAFILDGTQPGILYVSLTYFGYDYANQTEFPNSEMLTADFDEIIVLSDENRITGSLVTGLNLSYTGI